MSIKRRTHSAEFKEEVVTSILSGKMTRTEAQKKYKLSTSVLSNWVKKAGGGQLVRKSKKQKGLVVIESKALVADDVAHAMRDATLFLRQAKRELMGGIRSGKVTDLDQAHLLSLLALNSLQGG